MKPPIPDKEPPKRGVKLNDAQRIDMQYGLEPVIDPSVSVDGGAGRGGRLHAACFAADGSVVDSCEA